MIAGTYMSNQAHNMLCLLVFFFALCSQQPKPKKCVQQWHKPATQGAKKNVLVLIADRFLRHNIGGNYSQQSGQQCSTYLFFFALETQERWWPNAPTARGSQSPTFFFVREIGATIKKKKNHPQGAHLKQKNKAI